MMTIDEINSSERIDRIKSQKAKALFKHMQFHDSFSIPREWDVPRMFVLHTDDSDDIITSVSEYIEFPVFLRSCPETPRHGVIESIKCDDEQSLYENFEQLSNKMKEVDPNGCMIAMPFINATSSAVVAPSAVIKNGYHDDAGFYHPDKWFNGYAIFGPEHDGVTAGHGFQLGFPLRTNVNDNKILTALSFDPKVHELEFIFKSKDRTKYATDGVLGSSTHFEWNRKYLTQYRHAPEHIEITSPPQGVDTQGMIPQGTVEVKEVWVAEGLEEVAWLEENITKEKCPKGFVVQETGGSLLSHICAHCRQQEIPYVVGEVSVGDTWKEVAMGWVVLDPDGDFEVQVYNPLVYKDHFLEGVRLGNKYWTKQQGWFATFFHQWMALPYGKPQDVALLAGVFTAWLTKAVLALGLGEMRHAQSRQKNASTVLFSTITACIGQDLWREIHGTSHLSSSRRDYYVAMGKLEIDWDDAALMFDYLAKNYATGWSKAYGGKAWQESMLRGAKLARALSIFEADSTDDNLKVLIGAVNSCENAEHNNGFLFNKWLSKAAFDSATSGFNPRDNLQNMSHTYDMARQFIDDSFDIGIPMVSGKPPVNDWKPLLDYVMKKTPSYWRKSPLSINKNAPEVLRDVAKKLSHGWRHPERGSHNDPYSDDFITCGVDGCHTCNAHHQYLSDKEIIAEAPITSEYEGLENLVIAKPKLEVWLAGTQSHNVTVKDKIDAMVAGEWVPDVTEFHALFSKLEQTDIEYNMYMSKLSKWLIKSKDVLTEEFWIKLKDMESE